MGTKTGLYEVPYIKNVPHGFNKGFEKEFPNLRAESCSQHNELLVHKKSIRRLTPKECERLQGFPDEWTQYGIDENGKKIKISDTQRYKCLGNAVSVPCVKVVGDNLSESHEGRVRGAGE